MQKIFMISLLLFVISVSFISAEEDATIETYLQMKAALFESQPMPIDINTLPDEVKTAFLSWDKAAAIKAAQDKMRTAFEKQEISASVLNQIANFNAMIATFAQISANMPKSTPEQQKAGMEKLLAHPILGKMYVNLANDVEGGFSAHINLSKWFANQVLSDLNAHMKKSLGSAWIDLTISMPTTGTEALKYTEADRMKCYGIAYTMSTASKLDPQAIRQCLIGSELTSCLSDVYEELQK